MALEEYVIRIITEDKDLDSTLVKLEKMGLIDKTNAEQFKKSQAEVRTEAKKTAGAIGEIQGVLDGYAKKVTSIGSGIIAAFAVERVTAFANEAIKKFAESEAKLNQFAFTVQNVNKQSARAFKELTQQAEDLSESLKNVVTKGQIRDIQQQAAVYGLTAKQIKILTPAVIDFAKAQGKTLPEAMHILLAAIGGQTKGLAGLGITFKDTGDKTKNLGLLMQDLARYSGSAAASINTTQSALDRLSNNADDLKKNIGEALVNGINSFLETGEDFIEGIGHMADAVFGLDENVRNLGTGVKLTDQAFKEFNANQMAVQIGLLQSQLAQVEKLGGGNVEALKKQIKDLNTEAFAIKNSTLSVKQLEKAIADLNKPENANTFKIFKDTDLTNAQKLIVLQQLLADLTAKTAENETAKGEADRLARIAKEEELLKKLIALRQQLIEETRQLEIDAIADETQQKIAAQIAQYEKERAAALVQEKELIEASKSTNKKIAEIALIDLDLLHKKMQASEKSHADQIAQIIEDARRAQLKADKDFADESLKIFKDLRDKKIAAANEGDAKAALAERVGLLKRLKAGQITQAEFDKEDLEIQRKKLINEAQTLEIMGRDSLAVREKILELDIRIQKNALDKEKKMMEDRLKIATQVATEIIAQQIRISEATEENISRQLDDQQRAITEQARLASMGLDNTLDFEKKRAAELEKARMDEQKRQEKLAKANEIAQLISAFFNAYNNYSKTESGRQAYMHAFQDTVAAKALAAAISGKFHDGGIVGEDGHASGSMLPTEADETLILAKKGEGILSQEEMKVIGKDGFYSLKAALKNPIPTDGPMLANDHMKYVASEMAALRESFESIPRIHQGIDGLGRIVQTEVKRALRKITVKEPRKF